MRDKKGTKKVVADHLSQILFETLQPIPAHDSFPNEQLFEITPSEPPWYANIVNYLATSHQSLLIGPSKFNLIFGKIRIYLSIMLIRSFDHRSLRVNSIVFSHSAIH